ncbi:hypothetical protein HDU97_004051 [Phlyctochytrium planicorne]|nr:hypothetical protein HDU97_004051 [Phlyctochytrium planicorne]
MEKTHSRRSRKFSLAAASSVHWKRPQPLLAAEDIPESPPTVQDVPKPDPMNLDVDQTPQKRRTSMYNITPADIAAVIKDQEESLRKSDEEKKIKEEVMERERKSREADLIVEHFGFPPIEFIDDVINSVNDLMYQAMEEFQRFVEGEVDDQVEVEKGMAALETLLENAIDKNFDKFELYALQNIFSIPRNASIVLPQYKDIDPNATEEVEAELDREIEELRRRLIAEKYINFRMKSASRILERDLPHLEKILSDIKAGVGDMAEEGGQKLKSTLTQIQHQLAELRRLSHNALARSTPATASEGLIAKSQSNVRTLTETISAYLAQRQQQQNRSGEGVAVGGLIGAGGDVDQHAPVFPWKAVGEGMPGKAEIDEALAIGPVPNDLAGSTIDGSLTLKRF